jgi:uncharacterized membrane protein
MKKAYGLTILIVAVAIVALGFALASADEADAAQYDIKLKFNDTSNLRMAKGLNPVGFNYTVKHTGEVLSQEVIVELQNEPPAWQHFFSSTTQAGTSISTGNLEILLGRGEEVKVSLTINPALNQLNMTYWFTVNAYPKKDVGRNMSHEIGVIIPQVSAFEISVWQPPPGGEFKAIPPSTVTIRFALYNLGNGVDRFLIGGESSRSEAGWVLNRESGIDEFYWTPNLTADPTKKSPHFIDFKIPIPAGERAGITAQITVNATSRFNMSKQMPPAFATIRSLQYYNFQVYINGPDKKDGTPGEQVEFQIKINNLGNGWDEFSIKPVWDAELNPEFIASTNPRSILIDTETNDTIQYIVKVPESAPKKTYFFTAEVMSSSPELSPVTKSFAVEVGQYFAISIASDEPRMSTIPGGILDYELSVKNTGNGLDSIVIDLLGYPTGWLTYIQPPEVSLLQEQESVIQIRVIVPSRFDEAPIGSYNLTVKADSSRSEAQALFDIKVDITQFYRIEWMYGDEAITDPLQPVAQQGIIKPRRSFNPFEKNTIDITLEVKNFGNGDDNITMDGYSPDSRITVKVAPTHTLLLRDQTKFVKVTVDVPEDLPPGIYNLYVNGSSQDEQFVTRIVPLDFEVFNYDAKVDPIPTFIDPGSGDVVRAELSVQQGSNLSFKLKIQNTGTKPMPSVTVKVFDNYEVKGEATRWNFFNFTTPPIAVGDRYIVGERPFTVENPPLFWYSNISGAHELEFKLFYDHQSDVTNDLSTINITVKTKVESGGGVVENPAFIGGMIAVAIAVVIVAGYVFVLRRKPQVDADLYSSIYGADFEDDVTVDAAPEAAGEETALTPEQEALYGDDLSDEGGDYDYEYDDEYDGDYEYTDEEPQA